MSTWDYWFDLEQWTHGEAARLSVCGICNAIQKCAKMHSESNAFMNCPSISRGDSIVRDKITNILNLMDSNSKFSIKALPGIRSITPQIIPLEYIAWALTKKSISLKQEMIDWYNEQIDNREDAQNSKRIIDDLQKQVDELKEQLSKKGHCDGRGMPTVICEMRRNGKTEQEIAELLSDKGQWCSNPQIGALLHENTKISGVTADAMTKHAQRLLGKA